MYFFSFEESSKSVMSRGARTLRQPARQPNKDYGCMYFCMYVGLKKVLSGSESRALFSSIGLKVAMKIAKNWERK